MIQFHHNCLLLSRSSSTRKVQAHHGGPRKFAQLRPSGDRHVLEEDRRRCGFCQNRRESNLRKFFYRLLNIETVRALIWNLLQTAVEFIAFFLLGTSFVDPFVVSACGSADTVVAPPVYILTSVLLCFVGMFTNFSVIAVFDQRYCSRRMFATAFVGVVSSVS